MKRTKAETSEKLYSSKFVARSLKLLSLDQCEGRLQTHTKHTGRRAEQRGSDGPRLWLTHRTTTISLWRRLRGQNEGDICMYKIDTFALTANVLPSGSYNTAP